MFHFFKTLSCVVISLQIFILLKSCSHANGFSFWDSDPEPTPGVQYGECELSNQNSVAESYYPPQHQDTNSYYNQPSSSYTPRRPGSGVRSASQQAGYFYPGRKRSARSYRQFPAEQTGYGYRNWNQDDLIASHNTVPIGSYVRVTNENNGLSVVVRIVDRGPDTVGRISSLSRAAFKQIGDLSTGIIPCYISLA